MVTRSAPTKTTSRWGPSWPWTDGDNKIWTVENPDKLADHQGHYVQVKGVANAEAATIRVETASLLPEPKQ
jgi:hypothetical protein